MAIRYRTTFKNCVYTALLKRWKEAENDNDWDFVWLDREQVQVYKTIYIYKYTHSKNQINIFNNLNIKLIKEVMDHVHLQPN